MIYVLHFRVSQISGSNVIEVKYLYVNSTLVVTKWCIKNDDFINLFNQIIATNDYLLIYAQLRSFVLTCNHSQPHFFILLTCTSFTL